MPVLFFFQEGTTVFRNPPLSECESFYEAAEGSATVCDSSMNTWK